MQNIEPQGPYELRISRTETKKSTRRKVNIKDLSRDALLIGLSGVLLWHFLNIWRYGQHLIQERNTIILCLETVGLLAIFIFGIGNYIKSLKRTTREEDNQ